MSLRNLDRLFDPSSIALIGAGGAPDSLGAVLAHNLFHSGFEGPVLPVEPGRRAVEGVLAYDGVEALPIAPDLAVVVAEPTALPALIAALGAHGTRAVVVAAPLAAVSEAAGLRQAMLDAARPHDVRILGPDSLGVMVPAIGLNASFGHLAPSAGRFGLVAQSGTMISATLDWSSAAGIGFSKVVSLGEMSDIDFGDMLDYLAIDPQTRAILLQIESIDEVRKFMSAARGAARVKPVIVIKAGRHRPAAQGPDDQMVAPDAIAEAAFARAGMLRVRTLAELGDATITLFSNVPVKGDRLAILGNGGWFGELAADALHDEGGRLAALSPETLETLGKSMPAGWSGGNPVDLLDDAPGERYAAALGALLEDRGVDGILVLNAPSAVASSTAAAQAVLEALGKRRRTVLASWMGGGEMEQAQHLFQDREIASYRTPEEAVSAFMHLVRYRRHQDMLTEIPHSPPGLAESEGTGAKAVIEAARAEGRDRLSEPEAMKLLADYGIAGVRVEAVATAAEAAAAAERLGGRVAVKIHSADIGDRGSVGGIALNLRAAEVESAAERIAARVAEAVPEAQVEGFIVQAMHRRGEAQELFLGMTHDPLFGPAIVFGQGGAAVEILDELAVALPPLNMSLAHQLMAETRVHRLLQGFGGRPAAALDDIATALVGLAELVTDLPEIRVVEINPLLADGAGVLALRARIKLRSIGAAERAQPGLRLAIKPYPRELEQALPLRDGRALRLRPIRPEDAPALKELYGRLTSEDRRQRFLGSSAELTEALAKWLTQIDYNREMALVALDPGSESAEILGVVRIVADADNRSAEYAVTVRSDLQGQGLGRALMERIIAQGRRQGLSEIWGHVLSENRGMLALVRKLGFSVKPAIGDPGIMDVRLLLDGPGTTEGPR